MQMPLNVVLRAHRIIFKISFFEEKYILCSYNAIDEYFNKN